MLKDRVQALGRVLFASTVMVFVFAIFNALYGFGRLAAIEAALLPVLAFILWRLKAGASVARVEDGLMGCAAVLFSALFVEGGIGDTGIYWVIGFPFVAYFIKGSAHGMRWSIGFLLWLLIWIGLERQGFVHLDYSSDQLRLFAVVYGFYAWLAHLFKSQIELHQQQMLEANRQLLDESERHRLTRCRMQVILDHSPIAVYMQRDGETVFLNKACRQWHGMDDDDATHIVDGLYGLLPQDAVAQFRDEDAECLARPDHPLLRRVTIHSADGRERIVDMIRVGLRAEDGQQGNILIGFGVDVTERVRAEQQEVALQMQMQHVQRLESLGMMAGGIAHDFNNVLTAIQGSAELALAERGNSDTVTEHLSSICEASGLAAMLCQQMLAYSGKGRFVVQPVGLTEMVQDMRRLLEASVPKGVEIVYDLGGDLPAADCDVAQLRQVVLNLVLNAGEAIESGQGRIEIRTGCVDAGGDFFDDAIPPMDKGLAPATYLWFEVRDNGQGMAPDVAARIFDPFFTTKAKGHGLGMSAVQGIVRSHGGAMKLDSEPGKGTVIRVYLPVSEARVTPQPEAADLLVDVADMQGTVLLVDDDDTVRMVAKKMLQSMGFEVVEACDGIEALNVFRAAAEAFDCVVLDLTMPRMDGLTCMREIYRLRPSVPVVLSSGYNRDDDVQGKDAGAIAREFLKKPYSFDVMRTVMARAIQDSAA
ncbi:MAG TPA: ATP-binding protein [Mariprofundaceae bacterium]|nr:ATP-binding protein [Mariprofundaceae bacterium]